MSLGVVEYPLKTYATSDVVVEPCSQVQSFNHPPKLPNQLPVRSIWDKEKLKTNRSLQDNTKISDDYTQYSAKSIEI